MGCSPWDRAHKDSIRTALMSGRGARTIGKSPVRNILGDVFGDFNVMFFEFFYTASIHGNKELAMCTFAQGFATETEGSAES
eukprot:255254-Pelagomonas_calceolata.AAC.1